MSHVLACLVVTSLLVSALVSAAPAPTPAPPVTAEPSLVVLIVVDGLRHGEIERWLPHLGGGGFRRLLEGGVVFDRAFYPYATTKTCPGHATISTGALPSRHGIVGNDWYDRGSRAPVACMADLASPALDDDRGQGGGVSARWLRLPALADRLTAGGSSRAIAVSLKDRAAAMLAGRGGLAFWWGVDGFTTSRHYAAILPDYAAVWNRSRPRLGGARWDRIAAPALYEATGVDDDGRERPPAGFARTFPHLLPDEDSAVYTPFGADRVVDFALAAMAGERLGARPGARDLLAISVSTIDVIGHAYGPDSHEAIDALLRLDRAVAGLLDELDRRLGAAGYVIALTADHGMVSAPRTAAARVDGARITGAAEAALDARLGAGDWVEAFREPHLYLRPATVRGAGVPVEAAARIAARAIGRVAGVAAAFTASEVAAAGGRGLAAMVARSASPPRSGDVMVVAAAHTMIAPDDDMAASHGTPHDYDRHVPLIVAGPGVVAGHSQRAVSPADLAPTLAAWLGVTLPDASGTPLREAMPPPTVR
jgi:hypothetical protein